MQIQLDAFAVEAALDRGEVVLLPFYGGERMLALERSEIIAPGAQLILETENGEEGGDL